MTPREFYAIAAGRMESERHDLWKVAFLATSMYNSHPQWGKRKRKVVKPEDLVPSLKEGGRGGRKAQTPDEQLFLARMIHARFQAAQKQTQHV